MALHRQVFEWIRLTKGGPAVADALHNRTHGNFSSLTVAPALPDARSGQHLRRATGALQTDYFITLLPHGNETFARLCQGIDASDYTLEVDLAKVPLAREPEVVAECSYADMMRRAAKAKPTSYIRLRFSSPTHFNSNGLRQVMPEPVRIFKGYAERWNAFAPADYAIDLEQWEGFLRQCVGVTDMNIRTAQRVLKEDRHYVTHVGCVGEVTYCAVRPKDDQSTFADADTWMRYACWLHLLADYSEFCGTGRMVARGFGQTYRVTP